MLLGEQRRFAAGTSTTFLVLQRQLDVANQRGRELQAQTDLDKAIVELNRVSGGIFAQNGIDASALGGTDAQRRRREQRPAGGAVAGTVRRPGPPPAAVTSRFEQAAPAVSLSASRRPHHADRAGLLHHPGDEHRARQGVLRAVGWRFAADRYVHVTTRRCPGPRGRLRVARDLYFRVDDIAATIARVRELGGGAEEPQTARRGSAPSAATTWDGVSVWQPAAGY